MNEKLLIKAGYKRYPENGIVFPFSDFFYQKKFTDSWGIKYFIEFVHYPAVKGTFVGEGWMVVFRNENPPYEFKVHRIDKEIAFYEELVETLWKTLKCDYYELR